MVSMPERERRVKAVRSAMAADELDALIVCASGEGSERGRLRYLDGVYLWGGRCFYLLPLTGEPALFQPAYVGCDWAESVGWAKDHTASVNPAQSVADAVKDLGLGRSAIGVVGLESDMTLRDYRVLDRALSDARLMDATGLFNMVRAVKSEEEIGYMRNTSALLRHVYEVIETVLVPGVTEREVMAEATRAAQQLGSQSGFVHIARSGGLRMLHPPTDEVIQRSDVVTVDLEFIGQEGYALELSGHYSFGKPPDDVRRVYDTQLEVWERSCAAIGPGVSSRRILEVADATYRKLGFYAAGPVGHGPVQYHSHGIGLDFEEPPLVPGLDVTLEAGMVLSLHPHIGPENLALPYIWIEDNVLVTETGAEPLSYEERKWTTLEP